ncbi:MAG: hypothetical protein ACTHN5_00365 [Phycisphaerae bacterium]
MPNLKIEEVAKDAKLLPVLKAYMQASHTAENYDFYFSKDSCEKLYPKFISSKSATQVNLPSAIQKQLDELATAKKWKDMATPMQTAKKNIAAMVNADVMPRFMASNEYKAFLAKNAPAATVPPAAAKPAPAPVDLGPLKAKAAAIEKDIADGTNFVTIATSTVKSKGKPADREEVNRMFQSMRMRHDKVHEAFTALLQKDKNFTKANFGGTFAKKDAFTKLCMDYRKLLGA